MRRFLVPFILAGVLGCKADHASKASSQMDESITPATRQTLQSPSTTRIPADSRQLVVCFGDSLTAGFGADPGQSYPDFLQADLDHDGFNYRVVNEGISGNTTKDGIDRLGTILALHPAVVVVEFGGNDGLRGFKVSTTRENLATILTALKKQGTSIVLAGITLPPDYGPDYVKSFTGNYASLGKQYNVPVLPFLLQNVYGVPGMMQADNTHATNEGNKIVASNVLPYVEPLLQKH